MKKILVIDDMPELLELIGDILEPLSYEVITAHNGNEGLLKARIHKPDLVLTDLFMTPKPGMEVIVSLKKELPEIKIVAMSASVGKMNFLHLAKGMGADRILPKPIDSGMLISTLEELLA